MKVVNTKTQKEWDFVLSKFNPRKLASSVYEVYWETSVIILDGSPGTYANLDWAKKENCTVISFEDWCKENGHVTKVEVFPGVFVGDIVVSLTYHASSARVDGSIHVVTTESSKGSLYYTAINGENICNSTQEHWRLATEEEAKAFRDGVKNINDVPKKVEEMKFEVGQWYRGDIGKSIYYIKPFKLGNCARIDGETIINNTGYNSNNYFSNEGLTRILKPLTDLSEIQSYLPEGHPDKIWIPKKGEWVKVNKTSMGQDYDGSKYLGQVFQVSKVDSPSAYGPWVIGYKTNGHPPGGIYVCDLIPATSSEITKKLLLEEAISKYPMGTNIIFNVELQKFTVSNIDIVYGESGKGCLYYGGKWAEILNAEIIPKVGDYVVVDKYSKDYNGRVLEITTIKDNKYYYFNVIDGGYYRSGHNFSSNDGEIIRHATDLEILAGFRKYVENKSQFLARFQLDNYLKTCNMKLFNAIPGKTSSEKADYLWKECFVTIEKNELQVGGYVRFLINYGGHKKGTVGKITQINAQTISVNLPYYQTKDDCCLVSHEFEWLGMNFPSINPKIEWYEFTKDIFGQSIITKTPKESVKKGFDEAAYNNSPINQLIKLNIKKPKKVKIRL